MTQETPIRGKVARILNVRELALNVGQQDGTSVGMLFDILDPTGYEIKDPDTGEVIGSVNEPKVRVRIKLVQDKMSVATTYKGKRVNMGGRGQLGLAALLGGFDSSPPVWVTEYENLRTEEETLEELAEEESYVATGDIAVQVLEDDGESLDEQ